MRRILFFATFLLALYLPALGQNPDMSSGDSTRMAADSAAVTRLRVQLTEARLAEAELKMEVERLRMPLAADSAGRAARRQRIDSLRRVTQGCPVVVEQDTLFYLYTKRGGLTPSARTALTVEKIERLGRTLRLSPDSVRTEHSDIVSDVMYNNEVLVSIIDEDGLWAGTTRQALADSLRVRVIDKLHAMHAVHGWREMVKRILLFTLVLVIQYLLLRLTNWCFRRVRRRVYRRRSRLRPVLIKDYELLNTQRQVRLLVFSSNIARWIIILVELLISVPLLFAIFPTTQTLAYKLLSYIWTPMYDILTGVLAYIPNLFTIAVIWLVVRYAVKGLYFLAQEIGEEKLKIGGFYPDWAIPTFHIIRFLLYAFMLAMIYPYLPGSDSGIFKGISVFVGLIISLGSSTVVANIIAGLVITYMRPFRLGDRIKLNETTGKVIEKTAFVTRLRTPRNEVVTIPNSFIMSSHTVNYSSSAREYGLLIHTEVTIGYDTPWRKVHQLLIDSALATPGVVSQPEPFVLETALSDYYPIYQLHACIRDADRMAHILSELNQHIQDHFAQAGVEIMSPGYTAVRNGNASTIPDTDK